MSNSFNISVKPEIAAAVVKIDAIKTVIDDIHNTDLLNVTNIVTTSYAAVLDIHDTDLPAAVVKIDANKAVVDAIRATDVPNIQTNIDANETKIDLIPTSQLYGVDPSSGIFVDSSGDDFGVTTDYVLIKEFRSRISATYDIEFKLLTENGAANALCQIYKNGVAFGTERSTNSISGIVYNEELHFTIGDLIQFWCKTDNVTYWACVRFAFINGVIVDTPVIKTLGA